LAIITKVSQIILILVTTLLDFLVVGFIVVILCPISYSTHSLLGLDLPNVTTLILGSRPKQGVARLWAKKEAQESCRMLLGVQENVRE
jgi:hypothetical protein